VLRISLILTATWVVNLWQFELLAFTFWLVFQYFTSKESDGNIMAPLFFTLASDSLIALTDLAFSLDSVTTAIVVSQETWLVLTGATIGIITLRFMAVLFIRC